MATTKAPVQGIARLPADQTSLGGAALDVTGAGPHGPPATVEMPDFSGMFQPSTLYFETLYNSGDPMISTTTAPPFHAAVPSAAVSASKQQHGDRQRAGTTLHYDDENVRLGANSNSQPGSQATSPLPPVSTINPNLQIKEDPVAYSPGPVPGRNAMVPLRLFGKSPGKSPKKSPGSQKRRYSEPANAQCVASPNRAAKLRHVDGELPPPWIPNTDEACFQLFSQGESVSCTLVVVLDKGFKFSEFDAAFVGQKKNHFQVSYDVAMSKVPEFVATDRGLFAVKEVSFVLYGIKMDQPQVRVLIDQSKLDRVRGEFGGIVLDFLPDALDYHGTVTRLHFCQPTSNNMRRKGMPNPDQRYFSLIAAIMVKTENGMSYCVASKRTPGLIVRASNPRQFSTPESPPTQRTDFWSSSGDGEYKGIFRHGPVGINTSVPSPSDALSVNGNIFLRGRLLREPILRGQVELLDTSNSLRRVRSLEMMLHSGVDGVETVPAAVSIPNLRDVMPEAVVAYDGCAGTSSPSSSDNSNGRVGIEAMDVERLVYEMVGATQAMAQQLERAEGRIRGLEYDMQVLRARAHAHGMALSPMTMD